MSACDINELGNGDNKQNITLLNKQNSVNIVDKGPVKGGTLKLFSTYPDTLDPITTKNIYIQKYIGLVYESMVKLEKDQRPSTWLSDGWYVSEDGYTWTFHIREGVTWQDGFPLTAEDVEFTIKTIMSLENDSIYKFNLSNVNSFAAVDNNTIKIILKKPNSFTPELMTFPIIPKRFFTKGNMEDAYKTKFPPGTGPYSINSYEERKNITLKASRTWWYKKVNNAEDIPYIPEISIQLYEYSKDLFNAFQMRTVDVINVENEQFNRYFNKPDVFAKKFISNKFDFLVLNLSNSFLKDKAVRQAIASSIDRKEIIETVMLGQAVPSGIPVIPGSWIYNSDNAFEAENVELEILNQGRPVKLEILVNEENETRVKVAEKISDCLTEIGINASVRKAKWEDVLKLVNGKRYDIALLGCTVPSFPDISYLYSTWYMPYSLYTGNTTVYNIAGFNNEQVNDYIHRIFEENDYEVRKILFSEMKNIIDDEVPYIGLYFYYDAIFYNKNIRGDLDPYTWDEYNNIVKWYITE